MKQPIIETNNESGLDADKVCETPVVAKERVPAETIRACSPVSLGNA